LPILLFTTPWKFILSTTVEIAKYFMTRRPRGNGAKTGRRGRSPHKKPCSAVSMTLHDSQGCERPTTMMQIAAFLVFLAMGVTNLLAVQAGLTAVLGVPVLVALVVAVPVFYFRFVGSAAGIVGAIVGWQMSAPLAVLLFCWPVLVYGFLRGGAEARTFLARRAA
jgi:hypothetical protein